VKGAEAYGISNNIINRLSKSNLIFVFFFLIFITLASFKTETEEVK